MPARGISHRLPRSTRFRVTLSLPALLLIVSAFGASTARSAPRNGWCGPSERADWACGWEGTSVLTPPEGTERSLPLRNPLPLPERSRVTTAPSGSARLTLRSEAHCTVGGTGARPSQVDVRWEPDVLMRQISGDSSCTVAGRQAPVTTFCDASEVRCPVRIRAEGTYLLRGPGPLSDAFASTTGTEEFARHARLVICDGVARVKVRGEDEEAFGSANGHERFVIAIGEARAWAKAEVVLPTESGVAEADASVISLSVIGALRGPGPCEAPVVQEQKRSVET